MGNVTDEDVEPIYTHRPRLRLRKTFNPFRELRPSPQLSLE
jgi:hypothetical protein